MGVFSYKLRSFKHIYFNFYLKKINDLYLENVKTNFITYTYTWKRYGDMRMKRFCIVASLIYILYYIMYF